MKPRYAVIDQNKRDEFEKEWHLPYGYKDSFVTLNPKAAIQNIHDLVEGCHHDPSDLIVEKIGSEGRELYYRI